MSVEGKREGRNVNPKWVEIRTLRFEEKDIRKQFDKDGYPIPSLPFPEIQTSI
jgi:hypothetical protein